MILKNRLLLAKTFALLLFLRGVFGQASAVAGSQGSREKFALRGVFGQAGAVAGSQGSREKFAKLSRELREEDLLGNSEDLQLRISADKKLVELELERRYFGHFETLEDFGTFLDSAFEQISLNRHQTVYYHPTAGLLNLHLAAGAVETENRREELSSQFQNEATLSISTQLQSHSLSVSRRMIKLIKDYGFLGGINSADRVDPETLFKLVGDEDCHSFTKARLNCNFVLQRIGKYGRSFKTDVDWAKTPESVDMIEKTLKKKRLLNHHHSLAECLSSDNTVVFSDLKMSHQQLIGPLKRLLQSEPYKDKLSCFHFVDSGGIFDVELSYFTSRSPEKIFDDEESTKSYTIRISRNFAKKAMDINIPDYLVRSIYNYGFYGAFYLAAGVRVEPMSLYNMFFNNTSYLSSPEFGANLTCLGGVGN